MLKKIRHSGICLAIMLLLPAIVSPAAAASEDNIALGRRYLRCAAFYVFGSTGVSKPALRQQLQHLANVSLYSAELLMEKDKPLVKKEFDIAREKFLTETLSDEVKADTRGFLQYMGNHCNELRQTHPVEMPSSGFN